MACAAASRICPAWAFKRVGRNYGLFCGMKSVGVALLAVLMLATATGAYARVGWTRMEVACGSDPSLSQHGSDVSFSWSWSPTGFQCTYADGAVQTSLWF